MNANECMEIQTFGNCSKGQLCKFCNKSTNETSQTNNTDKNPVLNTKAKEFIPKKKNLNSNTENTINSNNSNQKTNEVENKMLKLNLNASEYVPTKINNVNNNNVIQGNTYSEQIQYSNYENSKVQEPYYDFDEPNEDELDMIMKDMMENDEMECEEESDDEKWFPKFKDCECCKGFVYKCKGNACQYLGACYCKVKNECEDGN